MTSLSEVNSPRRNHIGFRLESVSGMRPNAQNGPFRLATRWAEMLSDAHALMLRLVLS